MIVYIYKTTCENLLTKQRVCFQYFLEIQGHEAILDISIFYGNGWGTSQALL